MEVTHSQDKLIESLYEVRDVIILNAEICGRLSFNIMSIIVVEFVIRVFGVFAFTMFRSQNLIGALGLLWSSIVTLMRCRYLVYTIEIYNTSLEKMNFVSENRFARNMKENDNPLRN
ncbi:Hypothetical protein FKW44_005744 [Caligus rogercresseyi]|uniref:Uncharacterized protein n=1 Tax=Caligus rogercresseyi TaxID=217165 RepID=A0A7T8KCE4_CALRO|nr:Hypothetical protein FKW44_005744 [Caligus rogercresseyi]